MRGFSQSTHRSSNHLQCIRPEPNPSYEPAILQDAGDISDVLCQEDTGFGSVLGGINQNPVTSAPSAGMDLGGGLLVLTDP